MSALGSRTTVCFSAFSSVSVRSKYASAASVAVVTAQCLVVSTSVNGWPFCTTSVAVRTNDSCSLALIAASCLALPRSRVNCESSEPTSFCCKATRKKSLSFVSNSGAFSQVPTRALSAAGSLVTLATSSELAALPVSSVLTLFTYESAATGSKLAGGSVVAGAPAAIDLTQASKQPSACADTPVWLPNGIITPHGDDLKRTGSISRKIKLLSTLAGSTNSSPPHASLCEATPSSR